MTGTRDSPFAGYTAARVVPAHVATRGKTQTLVTQRDNATPADALLRVLYVRVLLCYPTSYRRLVMTLLGLQLPILAIGIISVGPLSPPDASKYVVVADGEFGKAHLERRGRLLANGDYRTRLVVPSAEGGGSTSTIDVNCQARTSRTRFVDWFSATGDLTWREPVWEERGLDADSALYRVTCLDKTPWADRSLGQ
jgi:hypothetical protein